MSSADSAAADLRISMAAFSGPASAVLRSSVTRHFVLDNDILLLVTECDNQAESALADQGWKGVHDYRRQPNAGYNSFHIGF